MATQNVSLYVNGPWNPGDPLFPGRLLLSPTSALPPILPPINGGDTWNIKVYYYLGDGTPVNPFVNVRYPGSVTQVRFRSAVGGGGVGTIYATANDSSEIVPAASSVTRAQTGGDFAIEKQDVAFDATGGYFTLTFASGTVTATALGNLATIATGGTVQIPAGASASQIESAINSSLHFYTWQGGVTRGGPFNSSQVDPTSLIRVTNWTQYKGFRLEYGTLRADTTNPHAYILPIAALDDSNLTFGYGWNVTLNLDGNGHTFSDLFLSANKPAYLEVAITPSGGSAQFASQTLLPSQGDSPTISNGPPPGATVNQPYSFTYQGTNSPTWAVTSGALPPGLSLSSSGLISGTPTQVGTFNGVVTASNAYGSATQTFVFVVNAVSGGGGGTGGSGTSDKGLVVINGPFASCYYDGNFTKPSAAGDIRFSVPDPEIPNGLVARQEFWQLRSQFSPVAIGSTISLAGQTWYLVQETEPRDLGGGICAWDRVFATKPGNYQKNVLVNKQYQWAQYIWDSTPTPPVPIYQGIISTTKPVTGVAVIEFYTDIYGLPALPGAPFIQLIKYFNSQVLTDLGSGFPTNRFNVNGKQTNPLYDSNIGYSFVSASIEPYMGKITKLIKLYA